MKIETKFDPGQEVWFMQDNKPSHKHILTVQATAGLVAFQNGMPPPTVSYGLFGETRMFEESELFLSKAELLASL